MRHSPRPPIEFTPALKARFDRSTRKTPDGCWEWAGARMNTGYGVFGIRNLSYRAHRVAFEMATGRHPGPLLVCHRCDNPGCVNPGHLWLGTNSENTRDMIRKGRARNGAMSGRRAIPEICRCGTRRSADTDRIVTTKGRSYRACPECLRANNRAFRARRRLLRITAAQCG